MVISESFRCSQVKVISDHPYHPVLAPLMHNYECTDRVTSGFFRNLLMADITDSSLIRNKFFYCFFQSFSDARFNVHQNSPSRVML